MKALKYFSCYITPFLVALSLLSSGIWTFTSMFVLFAFFPILELFLKASQKNLSDLEEELALADRRYDWILYALVPMQYGLLILFLFQMQRDDLLLYERIGMTMSMGAACGVIGINAAHELGHRLTKFEQNLSKVLLLTSLYMHFFIEHNRGHHKYVSTDRDPASSRYGESLYVFWFRSIVGSYISAWKLEKERLQIVKQPWLSWHNEMLRFQIIQVLFIVVVFLIFGLIPGIYFLFAAAMGILLLETVNYIEHYGLRRKLKQGNYERTLPIHSWNSNHPIGRLVLLELSRHSDHHYIASRKYQVLRHHDNSPQMPTGYPGMMILSFFPPLWFWVMHKRIKSYKASSGGECLA
jgi:alkane 1-monooxygenase